MPIALNQHRYYATTTQPKARRAKTACTSHVLAALGICSSTYHYSGTEQQMMTIARRRWSCRSVKSKLGKNPTVGGSRRKLAAAVREDASILAFVVIVDGHALLLDTTGKTTVDTAPRVRDQRKIRSIYAVRSK